MPGEDERKPATEKRTSEGTDRDETRKRTAREQARSELVALPLPVERSRGVGVELGLGLGPNGVPGLGVAVAVPDDVRVAHQVRQVPRRAGDGDAGHDVCQGEGCQLGLETRVRREAAYRWGWRLRGNGSEGSKVLATLPRLSVKFNKCLPGSYQV